MEGIKYKDVYVYMKTHKFWQGWQYFVSQGHIEEGFWVSEKTLTTTQENT
jgi:hypothetical protein